MVNDTAHLSEKPSGSPRSPLVVRSARYPISAFSLQQVRQDHLVPAPPPPLLQSFPPFSQPRNISFLVNSTHSERPAHLCDVPDASRSRRLFGPKRDHHACHSHDAWRAESYPFCTQIRIGSSQNLAHIFFPTSGSGFMNFMSSQTNRNYWTAGFPRRAIGWTR